MGREDVWRDWEWVCSEGEMGERMCGEIGSGYVRREEWGERMCGGSMQNKSYNGQPPSPREQKSPSSLETQAVLCGHADQPNHTTSLCYYHKRDLQLALIAVCPPFLREPRLRNGSEVAFLQEGGPGQVFQDRSSVDTSATR